MKKLTMTLAAFALAGIATPAMAQLMPYEDYDVSEGVSRVTTVKVDSNMMDHYLEAIRQTWIPAREIAVKLGYIQGYNIYTSELQESGDFNIMLVERFASAADLQPSRARFEAFMREYGEANRAASEEVSSTVYPEIREITGQYLVREVKIKPE